ALKRSSWCRIRVTRSARSAERRWNRGWKAPTFRFTNLSNVPIKSRNDQHGETQIEQTRLRGPSWLSGLSIRQLVSGRCPLLGLKEDIAGRSCTSALRAYATCPSGVQRAVFQSCAEAICQSKA